MACVRTESSGRASGTTNKCPLGHRQPASELTTFVPWGPGQSVGWVSCDGIPARSISRSVAGLSARQDAATLTCAYHTRGLPTVLLPADRAESFEVWQLQAAADAVNDTLKCTCAVRVGDCGVPVGVWLLVARPCSGPASSRHTHSHCYRRCVSQSASWSIWLELGRLGKWCHNPIYVPLGSPASLRRQLSGSCPSSCMAGL